jgi:hypothetical protein
MSSLPYIYWPGNNILDPTRLLVVGESAYQMDGDPRAPVDPTDVIKAIKAYLLGRESNDDATDKQPPGYMHFKKIFQTVYNPNTDWNSHLLEAIFNQITYVNYVQAPVGSNASCRPTPEQWQASWIPFREFLDKLKPRKVLVLGYTVWGDMITKIGVPKNEWETYQFPIPLSPSAKICVIKHPSSWNRHPKGAAKEQPKVTSQSCHAHFNNKLGGFP